MIYEIWNFYMWNNNMNINKLKDELLEKRNELGRWFIFYMLRERKDENVLGVV